MSNACQQLARTRAHLFSGAQLLDLVGHLVILGLHGALDLLQRALGALGLIQLLVQLLQLHRVLVTRLLNLYITTITSQSHCHFHIQTRIETSRT